MSWFSLFLFLHVLAAIVAFGPTFTFPFIGVLAQREPRHGAFALHLNEVLETRLVLPVGLTMPVTGAAMIIRQHIDLVRTTWLLAAVVVYVVAMLIGILVMTPTVSRALAIARSMPAPLPAGPGASVAAATGPPAELATLLGRMRALGGLLLLMLVTIVLLMVWKPGGIVLTV